MAKLTISDASRVAGVARSTLHRAIRAGRLSVDPDGHIDTAELLRAGYMLQLPAGALQDATPRSSDVLQGDIPLETQPLAAAHQERDLLRLERDLLRRELEAAHTREQAASEREQAAREREARLLHMLEQVQQQHQRVLEAPRSVPVSEVGPQSTPHATPRNGIMAQIRRWQREGMSLRAIATTLNAEGVPTRSGQGKWYESNLSRLLKKKAPTR